MTNAHVLIAGGLMSPKDWIGLAIDIEQFRKQDLGTTQLPGDFLKLWLSEPAHSDATPVAPHMPKREKKVKKAKNKFPLTGPREKFPPTELINVKAGE